MGGMGWVAEAAQHYRGQPGTASGSLTVLPTVCALQLPHAWLRSCAPARRAQDEEGDDADDAWLLQQQQAGGAAAADASFTGSPGKAGYQFSSQRRKLVNTSLDAYKMLVRAGWGWAPAGVASACAGVPRRRRPLAVPAFSQPPPPPPQPTAAHPAGGLHAVGGHGAGGVRRVHRAAARLHQARG